MLATTLAGAAEQSLSWIKFGAEGRWAAHEWAYPPAIVRVATHDLHGSSLRLGFSARRLSRLLLPRGTGQRKVNKQNSLEINATKSATGL